MIFFFCYKKIMFVVNFNVGIVKKLLLIAIFFIPIVFMQSCDKDETIPLIHKIGDLHQGGIIFYLDNTGEHGLVCAISDQSYGTEWGCLPTLVTDADELSIGAGAQNTLDIISVCTSSDIAAAICNDLILNEYDDWFLPSKDELDKIHESLDIINSSSKDNGGEMIQTTNYWTSSRFGGDTAWVQNMDSGGRQYTNLVDKSNHVRAVRIF